MILTPFQKLPSYVGDLGKIIVAIGFEWMSKVHKIAQSGHTGRYRRGKQCAGSSLINSLNNSKSIAA